MKNNLQTLKIQQLKKAIYREFNTKNTAELINSGRFKLSVDGMEVMDLRRKKDWERLYRKFIGTLPSEVNQKGYGCINGIHIFNYYDPWGVFDLDPATATAEDIKATYRQLSKTYHPDNRETGDANIFNRINQMYRGLTATP